MPFVIRGLDHPAIEATGWSLLHFVWQGLTVAGLLMALLLMLRRANAPTRYFVSCAALVVMALCPVCTWCWMVAHPSNPDVVALTPRRPNMDTVEQTTPTETSQLQPMLNQLAIDILSSSGHVGAAAEPDGAAIAAPTIPQPAERSVSPITTDPPLALIRTWIVPLLPWLVIGWMLGVFLQSIRLLVVWRFVQRIQRLASSPAIGELHSRCQQIANQLGIRRSVKLVQSALIEVPTVLGWLRPLILLPAQALTGLDVAQMDAILAHELAHIRRQDYLVNLIQTSLETLLFYHPAVWWVSHQIRAEREHCCDDIAVEVCGNRVIYARALAEMEELRASPQLTLAVNSGSLLGRIRRLIRPASASEKSIWWAASPIAIAVVGVLLTGAYLASSAKADPPNPAQAPTSEQKEAPGEPKVDDKESAELRADLKRAIDRARVSLIKTKTVHVTYRVARGFGPYKPGTDAARCAELLQKYDLIKRPDDLRHVVQELYAEPELFGDSPWSEAELFVDGNKVRNSTASREGKSNSHIQITDDQFALRWDLANAQVDIHNVKDNHYHQTTLNDFRDVLPTISEKAQVTRKDGQFTLTINGESGSFKETVVDEVTGFLTRLRLRYSDQTILESHWLGWQTRADGIPFPRLVAHFKFQRGIPNSSEIMIVHNANFNSPLVPSLFKMDAPAGSVIVDYRNIGRLVTSINFDVFDVTSAEQMAQATRRLPVELTPEQKAGIAELKQIYQLADGELIKRIGPPYPLSHKHLARMLGRASVPKPGRTLTELIQWRDGALRDSYFYEGLTPHFSDLIYRFLKFDKTQISADAAILDREIVGDFIYRPDAPVEGLANEFAKIASREFQIPLKLNIRDSKRPVYVARGELKLQLPTGQKSILLNGGPHPGSFPEDRSSGDSNRFLKDVTDYVGVRIINETQPAQQQLEWTQRLYNLSSIKPEKWFKVDPEICLKQITEQTGITFTKEMRTDRILFVEVDPAHAAGTANSKGKSAEGDKSPDGPAAADPQSSPTTANKKEGQSKPPETGTCELSGNVLDKRGRLVKGATIQVWRSDGVGKINLVEHRMPRPLSDDDGRFEIPDLPAGDVTVSATFPVAMGTSSRDVVSSRQAVTLAPKQRAYCRIQLIETVMPEAREKYLQSGKSHINSTWTAFEFDPRSMQVAGHQPPEKREALNWGTIENGLQAALVFTVGKTPHSQIATLVLRNTLKDRMLGFHRQKDREQFAFEVIQPDGAIQVQERDIWPFNKLRPSHFWNGIYLRPGDEYDITLGEVDLPVKGEFQIGTSVRARLMLFSDNEKNDHVRQEEFYPTSLVETGWVPWGHLIKDSDAKAKSEDTPLVRLWIVDQKSGQPLQKFSVVPGVEGMLGDVHEAMPFIQWQPHLWREGQGGKLEWPQQRAYDTMRLRIEADGYQPGLTQLIRKANGPMTIQVKLVPDAGLDGRILSPNGQPAGKAQVGVAMSAREIRIADRRITVPEKLPEHPADKWRLPLIVEADAQGRFHLPAEITPALVIVTHESGYAEIRRDQLTSATSTITLRPWGRIEGRLLWRDLPGKNQNISLIVSHPNPEWIPLVHHSAKTKTDAEGRFIFDGVPTGLAQINREQELTTSADSSRSSGYYFPIMHVDVKATGPTQVILGGKGQPVIGQLKGLADWKDITVRIFPYAPRPGDGDLWAGYSEFASTPAGKLYHRDGIPVQADGTFRIERVLSENYQWQATEANGGIVARGQFRVPPTAEGKSDQAIDLGSHEIDQR
jgi:beta-lactamase regulating signal transducer with metallopeptidase domain